MKKASFKQPTIWKRQGSTHKDFGHALFQRTENSITKRTTDEITYRALPHHCTRFIGSN